MTRSRIFRATVASVLAVSALSMAAQAGAITFDLSPQQPGRLRAAPDAAAIKALPANFRFAEPGVLTVGLTVAYPPISTYATDAKTVIGYDPDLAQLVADELGLKLKLVPLAWPEWPLALQSGKVDVVLSNVTVTEQRKQKFDFSSYRRDELGFFVANNSPIKSIREPKDIAGLRVITDAGTNQEKIALEWNKENIAHGLKPAQFIYYDDFGARSIALQAGRADVILSVNAALAYVAAQKGALRSVGTISGGWPRTAEVAVTTRKGSGLADPITVVLNNLIASGKYRQELDRWGLGNEAIEHSVTNPPGLPEE